MKDSICCCIFCLGMGMIVGAVIVANNKKVHSMVQDGSKKIAEKFEDIKSSMEQKQNTTSQNPKNNSKSNN